MLCALRISPRRLARDEEGAALVEFAIIVPVMLILLLGTAEIGRAVWYHHIVNEGIRDGVRYLARMPLTATFIDQSKNMVLTGSPVGGSPRLAYWTDPTTINVAVTNVDNSAGTYRGPDPLPVITMTATVPFSFPLLNFLGIGPTITVTVADQQRHIGR